MSNTKKTLPLGALLVEKGLLTEDQLRIALLEQRRSGTPLGKLLVALGFVSEGVLREALSENLGHHSIDLSRTVADLQAIRLIPKELAKRLLALPVGLDSAAAVLTVAMVDPNNLVALDQLRLQTRDQYLSLIHI